MMSIDVPRTSKVYNMLNLNHFKIILNRCVNIVIFKMSLSIQRNSYYDNSMQ
jgi:hypothetical protein